MARKVFTFLTLLVIHLPVLSFAAGTCNLQNGISTIGLEYIADTCPPENADDNTYYHYINNNIRCSGGLVTLYTNYGDYSGTPAQLINFVRASYGSTYRIFRNTEGNHVVLVHRYYTGLIEGLDMDDYAVGQVYYDQFGAAFIPPADIDTDDDGDGAIACDDCDDSDPAIYPGALEICDGRDNDCDGQVDEDLDEDADGDGHYTPGSCQAPHDDCDDNDATVYPGAPEILCDGIDQNCNGLADDDENIDNDPVSVCTGDCDDSDAEIYPDAPEICDGRDNNCDGQVDEGCDLIEEDKNFGGMQDTNTGFGDPINVVTGNVFRRDTDLPSGQTPLALEFVRHYNSRSNSSRSLGYGWRHTYDRYLTFSSDNIVAWREDGRAVYFSASTLLPESGARERLSYNPDGTYVLTRTDDLKETYDSGGRLADITDLSGNTQALSYDGNGKLATVSDPFGRRLILAYDASGRLTTLTDPEANNILYAYDADGNLIEVIYQDGSSKSYRYEDGDIHNLTGITNENGNRIMSYAYDGQDRVVWTNDLRGDGLATIRYMDAATTVTYAGGDITAFDLSVKQGIGLAEHIAGPGCAACGNSISRQFTYDDDLNIASVTDGNGVTANYTYDPEGNMLSRIEAAGTAEQRTTTYTYEPGLHKICSIVQESVEPGHNKIVAFEYDENGNLTQETETGYAGGTPFTHTTTYAYTSRGQVARIDGPRNDVSDETIFTYDAQGNPAAVSRGGLLTTTYSDYNGFGRPGRIVDPNGVTTIMSYDARSHLTAVITPSGSTNYTYDPVGNLIRVDLPNGNELHLSYNEANRPIQIADGLGNTISYTYDSMGNRTGEQIHDPAATLTRTLSHEHDAFGRLLKVVYPDAAEETFAFDANGNRINSTDANGNATASAYDNLNRLIQVIQPGNISTAYTYDTGDNLTSLTDAEGHLSMYTYDDAGRLLETISPDTGTILYDYDAAGNLTSKTDANGVTVIYTYDSLNRLTKVDYPNQPDVTYVYDSGTNGIGRLTGVTDAGGTYAFSYDALGNLIREETTVEGASFTTEYSYDTADHLTGLIYPSGRTVSYQLDAAGRIISVSTSKDGVTTTLADNISYAPYGPMTGLTYGNEIAFFKTLDQRYQITALQAGNALELGYARDRAGNITQITNMLDSSRSQSFGYDVLNRLASATGIYGAIDYTYDAVGNRQSRTQNGRTDTYAYVPGTNRLASITGANPASYGYDAGGNISGVNSKGFIYNENNRLIEALDDGSAVGDYIYNSRGQRALKQTDASSTIYLYDLHGKLIAEADANGHIRLEYFYVNGERVAVADLGGAAGGLEPICDLYARAKKAKVSLTWRIVAGAACYNIYRSETSGGPYSQIAQCHMTHYATYLDEDVVNKTTYYYLVTSVDDGGQESDYSNEADATPGRRRTRAETTFGDLKPNQMCLGAINYLKLLKARRMQKKRRLLAGLRARRHLWAQTNDQQGMQPAIYYFHNDHLGTPLKLTDENGTVVWRADYTPFGKASIDDDPDGDGQAVEINFRPAGQYFDSETGLHYNYHRYYDPQLGRYLRTDPIGLAGGVNPYVYVFNNPVNLVDPYGLRDYTILDLPDLLVTPFQAHSFKENMKRIFREQSEQSTLVENQKKWGKLAEDYKYSDALTDMYRFDEKEALEHYQNKIGIEPELFWTALENSDDECKN